MNRLCEIALYPLVKFTGITRVHVRREPVWSDKLADLQNANTPLLTVERNGKVEWTEREHVVVFNYGRIEYTRQELINDTKTKRTVADAWGIAWGDVGAVKPHVLENDGEAVAVVFKSREVAGEVIDLLGTYEDELRKGRAKARHDKKFPKLPEYLRKYVGKQVIEEDVLYILNWRPGDVWCDALGKDMTPVYAAPSEAAKCKEAAERRNNAVRWQVEKWEAERQVLIGLKPVLVAKAVNRFWPSGEDEARLSSYMRESGRPVRDPDHAIWLDDKMTRVKAA
jgi:hypothetical protein